MSADLHFIGCHAFDRSFGWLFSVEAEFSEKSFPPKRLRWINNSISFIDKLAASRGWMNDELFAQRDIDAGLAEWLAPLLCLLAMERKWIVVIATVKSYSRCSTFEWMRQRWIRRHSNCCSIWLAETEFITEGNYNRLSAAFSSIKHPPFKSVWKSPRFPLRVSAQLRRHWSETGSCQQIKYLKFFFFVKSLGEDDPFPEKAWVGCTGKKSDVSIWNRRVFHRFFIFWIQVFD